MEAEIKHLEGKILLLVDGVEASELIYNVEEGLMKITQIYTKPEYRGRGYARRLMKEALKLAGSKGLQVVPLCSYADSYMKKKGKMPITFKIAKTQL